MRIKQLNMKSYKILSFVLALAVLMSGLGVRYHSNIMSNTVEALDNNSVFDTLKDTVSADATFYDYYYDNQIENNNSYLYNQGSIGSYQNSGSPYTTWNSAISALDMTYPLYIGGFWDQNGGNFNDSVKNYYLSEYNSFYWAVNLAQRNNGYLPMQGLVQENLNYGTIIAEDGTKLPYFDDDFVTSNKYVNQSISGVFAITAINGVSGSTWPNSTTIEYKANSKVSNWLNGNKYQLSLNKNYDIYIKGQGSNQNSVWVSESDRNDNKTFITVYFQDWGVDDCPESLILNIYGNSVSSIRKTNMNVINSDDSQTVAKYEFDDISFLNNITTDGQRIGDITKVNNFPFYLVKDNNSYRYEFNSKNTDHVVYVNKENGTLVDKKRDGANIYAIKNGYGGNDAYTGFYPFNKNETNNQSEIGQANLNYGFGIKFEIDFNISNDGKDLLGNDMEFNFRGDDDVWIFIDNKLVLDLGGDHGITGSSVNFVTGEIKIGNEDLSSLGAIILDDDTKDNVFLSNWNDGRDTLSNIFGSDWKTKLYGKKHKLTIFYMERGMLESNLYMSFNFIFDNELTLVEETTFKNVNDGLLNATKIAADKDVFSYKVENKGTTNSDVIDSGILNPTYANYIRKNFADNNNKANTILSGIQIETIITKLSNEYDTTGIYLDLNNSSTPWTSDDGVVGVWAFKEGGIDGHLVLGECVEGYDNIYRFNLEYNGGICSEVNFLRLSPIDDSNYVDGQTTWPGPWGEGNQTSDISVQVGKIYTLSNAWSYPTVSTIDESIEITTTTTNENYLTKNWQPGIDINNYKAVNNVTYQIDDPLAEMTGEMPKVDYMSGNTNDDGYLKLMYGQNATFKSQFLIESSMKVTQDNSLLAPTGWNDVNKKEYNNNGILTKSTSREVSKFYTTTVSVVDSENKNLGNITNGGTYKYKNAEDSNKEFVKITQTFINDINTATLSITKKTKNNENSDEEFTIYLELTNIFGQEGINAKSGDYIDYIVDEERHTSEFNDKSIAEIKLKAGETANITGIPVGTVYTITEKDSTDFKLENIIDSSNGTVESKDDITVTVTNERKTGSLVLQKDVKDNNGSDNDVTNTDKNTKFTFNVTLTPLDGVDLSNYSINANDVTVVLVDNSFKVQVSENNPVTITGIPYGTTYTITEDTISDWTQTGTSDTTGIINSDSVTAKITNKKNIVLTTDSYLTITKYIDKLYYNSEDNAHGFINSYSIIDGNNAEYDKYGYLKYTNAEQDFKFKVEKCDGNNVVETYQVILKFEADMSRLEKAENDNYYYVQSKRFKVESGYTYNVTEIGIGNGLSWRYDFISAKGEGVENNIDGQTVSFNYAVSAEIAQEAIATFYDKKNEKSQKIESDMSSIENNIKSA